MMPGTCQVGRLVRRPGGPPRQMLRAGLKSQSAPTVNLSWGNNGFWSLFEEPQIYLINYIFIVLIVIVTYVAHKTYKAFQITSESPHV